MFLLIPTLLGVSVFVFMAVRFLPGDAIDQMFSDYIRSPDPEARAALEERFQLNRSILCSTSSGWAGSSAATSVTRS